MQQLRPPNEVAHVLAVDHHFPSGDSRVADETVESRTLASTVDTQKREDLTSFHSKRCAFDRIEAFLLFGFALIV